MPTILVNLSFTGHLSPLSWMIMKYKSRPLTIHMKTTGALHCTSNSTVNISEYPSNLSTAFKMRFSSLTIPSIALLLTVAAAAPAQVDASTLAPVEKPLSNSTAIDPVEGGEDGQMGIMNFNDSCGACYMDGARLICLCRTKAGFRRWTETDLAQRIGNSRGTLVYNS